jgi:hypothetical protein
MMGNKKKNSIQCYIPCIQVSPTARSDGQTRSWLENPVFNALEIRRSSGAAAAMLGSNAEQ